MFRNIPKVEFDQAFWQPLGPNRLEGLFRNKFYFDRFLFLPLFFPPHEKNLNSQCQYHNRCAWCGSTHLILQEQDASVSVVQKPVPGIFNSSEDKALEVIALEAAKKFNLSM